MNQPCSTVWMFLAAALALVPLQAISRADVATPDPKTHWARGQEPSRQSLIIAGGSISAAVVAAGLLLAIAPIGRSTAARGVIGVASLLLLLAVGGVVWSYARLAEEDRQAWKQWEKDEAERRSNWVGPPLPEPPVPPVPLDTPPTAEPPPASAAAD